MSAGGWLATLLGGGVFSFLGLVIVALVRNSKRSPEVRTALDSGWEKLTGGLQAQITTFQTSAEATQAEVAALEQRVDHQSDRIVDLEDTVASLRSALTKLRALNAWLSRRVAQLVAFIASHDLVPPAEEPRPPVDDDEL